VRVIVVDASAVKECSSYADLIEFNFPSSHFDHERRLVAKKQKANGDLMTDEERKLPLGMGYTVAADRLGLIYLMDPGVMVRLLVDFANEAYDFSMNVRLTKGPFWRAMNQKADKLAAILKGRNSAYMAPAWFTDPNQLRASLCQQMNLAMPNDPANAAWRKDPIRAHARAFMAFFLELSEGAIDGQGRIPNKKLATDHIRKYAGGFMGMDPAILPLNLTTRQKTPKS
jgi:hypothetical protein